MDGTTRTWLAALVALLVIGGSVAGLAVFLGFPATPSLVTGAVLGVASGALILAAGRRAETFHPTDPNAHLADHRDDGEPDETTPGA